MGTVGDDGYGLLIRGAVGVPLLWGGWVMCGESSITSIGLRSAPPRRPSARNKDPPCLGTVPSDQESLARLGLKRMCSTPIVMASFTVGGRRC